MYNFEELNKMDEERLKEAANTIGIKKINIDDREGLVYEILEKQARDHAANASANGPTQEKPRRQKKEPKENNAERKQRRKKTTAEEPIAQAEDTITEAIQPIEQTASADDTATLATESAPKRRGRKPKNAPQPAQPDSGSEIVESEPMIPVQTETTQQEETTLRT